MKTLWTRACDGAMASCIGLVLLLALAGCGGGGDAADATPLLIGAAGGTVSGPDGAQVSVPAQAFAGPVTVRISKDSTGAPPLPAAMKAAGPVYAITPHGGDFGRHVEVTIPLPAEPEAAGEQRVLVTAEAGATRWAVLSGATPFGNALRVPVMHFSFFQIVTLADVRTPTVTLVVGRMASVPVPGTTQIAADHAITSGVALSDLPDFSFEARVQPPSLPARAPGVAAPAASPRLCMPSDLGPAGARLEVRQNGAVLPIGIYHASLAAAQAGTWPRNRLEAAPQGFIDTALGWGSYNGPGVAHFWGQDQPRSGAWVELDRRTYPAPIGLDIDRYTLPPAGNLPADDELIWYGRFGFTPGHSGPTRIDASVATDCGFDVAAVPVAFRLELTGAGIFDFYPGVQPLADTLTANLGDDVELAFSNLCCGNDWNRPERLQTDMQEVTSLSWETSTDGIVWRPAPELAQDAVVDTRYFDDLIGDFGSYAEHTVLRYDTLRFADVGPGRAGFYRANACIRIVVPGVAPSGAPQCQVSRPVRLDVVSIPPTVTRQPVGQTVLVGESASLSIAVAGPPPVDLRWQKRSLADAFLQRPWVDIPGATTASYTTSPLTMADHPTFYRVAYANASGGGFSDVATVSVVEQLAPPAIVAQPGSLNVEAGGTAVFAATVGGSAPLSFQWRRNGVDIAGANAPLLTLANVGSADDGRYDLVVTNRAGSVTSEPATLVVTQGTPVPLPPSIAAPPVSLAVPQGSAANFAVAVTGTGPYSYVWTREGAAQPVGTDPILAFASVQPGDAGRYQVRVTNTVGTVLSGYAALTVGPAGQPSVAPVILTPPAASAVFPGMAAQFVVAASGSGPLTYQWRRDGQDIVGATAALLSIGTVGAGDAGQYSVEVRNSAGTALSPAVPLVVIGAPRIQVQPTATSRTAGDRATFLVEAIGDALRYQWTRNSIAIDGATAASYTTPPLALGDSGAVYAVIVYNGAGLVMSSGAVLTVAPAVTSSDPSGKLALGAAHACAVEADYTVACWGVNNQGQLGNGSTASASAPAAVSGLTGVISVAVGSRGFYSNHWGQSCAVQASGSLWCWGRDVNAIDQLVPQAVAGVTDARSVAVGSGHACYLDTTGSVHCWGFDISGELGDGRFGNPQPAPALVQRDGATLTGIVAIGAGDSWTCALAADGSVWCWGVDHTGNAEFNPMAVPGVSGATRLAVGAAHACAVVAGGAVRCWGYGGNGQLGNGGTATSVASVAVSGLSEVTALAAGHTHTCARRSGGEVVCWGSANLGNGSNGATTPGAAVTGLDSVSTLAAGQGATCALRSDGQVLCWGSNLYGQLGVSDTGDRAAPTATAAGASFWHP